MGIVHADNPRGVVTLSAGVTRMDAHHLGNGYDGLKEADRALYQAIVDSGGLAYHDSDVKVITSGRRQARAPMGFSHALTAIDVGLRSAGSEA